MFAAGCSLRRARDGAACTNRSRFVVEERLPPFANECPTRPHPWPGWRGVYAMIRGRDVLSAHRTVVLPPARFPRETFSPETVSPNSRIFQEMMGATVSFARWFTGKACSSGWIIWKIRDDLQSILHTYAVGFPFWCGKTGSVLPLASLWFMKPFSFAVHGFVVA